MKTVASVLVCSHFKRGVEILTSAQGSEYPAVVLPLLSGPRLLMNRNLLYTAVTRAKQCVTIVGNAATVWSMIENTDEMKRYSGLKRHLEEMNE